MQFVRRTLPVLRGGVHAHSYLCRHGVYSAQEFSVGDSDFKFMRIYENKTISACQLNIRISLLDSDEGRRVINALNTYAGEENEVVRMLKEAGYPTTYLNVVDSGSISSGRSSPSTKLEKLEEEMSALLIAMIALGVVVLFAVLSSVWYLRGRLDSKALPSTDGANVEMKEQPRSERNVFSSNGGRSTVNPVHGLDLTEVTVNLGQAGRSPWDGMRSKSVDKH